MRITEIIREPKLNTGIYIIPDIARIFHLPLDKTRRWLNLYWDKKMVPGEKYTWGDSKNKATSFFTMIEFYIFYQLKELKIPTSKIMETHTFLSEKLNTPYPFATEKIKTDGSELFYLIDEIPVTANIKHKYPFKEIIEYYFEKIDFNNESIAERYFPLGKKRTIVVDPKHQFGQPTIAGTNILVDTIIGFIKGGENDEIIASLYNLNIDTINDVKEYIRERAA